MWNKLTQQSIRVKLIIIIPLITLIFWLISSGITINKLSKQISEEYQGRGEFLTKKIAQLTLNDIKYSDLFQLHRIINEFTEEKNIKYLLVFNQDQKIIAQAPSLLSSKLASQNLFSLPADSKQLLISKIKSENDSIMDFCYKIIAQDQYWGTIRLGLSLREVKGIILSYKLSFLVSGVIILILEIIFIILITHLIISPIPRLAKEMKKVGSGKFENINLENLSTHGEIGILTQTFKEMLEKIKNYQTESNRNARLAAIGNLVSELAHEIRNPLNTIKTFSDLIGQHFQDPEFIQEYQKLVPHEVERIRKLTYELLDFTKPINLQFEKTDFHQTLSKVLTQAKINENGKKIEIKTNFSKEIEEFNFDPTAIERALENLINNSLDAIDQTGELKISTQKIFNGKDYLKLTVQDSGIGISKENLNSIFDPYFTTKKEGTGLGLSIVHKIITAHEGRIQAESQINQGTTFTIWIPIKK